MKKIISLATALFIFGFSNFSQAAACSLTSLAGGYSVVTLKTIKGNFYGDGLNVNVDNGFNGILTLTSTGTATFAENDIAPQVTGTGTYTFNPACTVNLSITMDFGVGTLLANQKMTAVLIASDMKTITAVDYPNQLSGNLMMPNLAIPNIWYGSVVNHGYNAVIQANRRYKK